MQSWDRQRMIHYGIGNALLNTPGEALMDYSTGFLLDRTTKYFTVEGMLKGQCLQMNILV
jgi:hypothetical protein